MIGLLELGRAAMGAGRAAGLDAIPAIETTRVEKIKIKRFIINVPPNRVFSDH